MKEQTRERIWLAGLAALAAAFHVQPTLAVGTADVRFAMSDVAGLLATPLALWIAWVNRSKLARRELWIACLLAAAASGVMTLGLVTADVSPHGISRWAIVKYIGWYALVYYGALGLLCAIVAPARALSGFVRVYILLHAVLIVAFIALAILGMRWPVVELPRLTGLFSNPNAYGLSLLCGLALLIGPGQRIFGDWAGRRLEILAALLCAGLLFTRSLGALGGLVTIGVIVLCTRRDFVRVLRIACIALALYVLPWAGNSLLERIGVSVGQLQTGIGGKLSDPDKYSFSLSARIESAHRGLTHWRSAPVLGVGLGVFYESEKSTTTNLRHAVQLHNTPLWILTEFGLVGISVFGAIFAGLLFYLLRAWRRTAGADPVTADFVASGLLIVGAWAVMSQAHELLYQRIPWYVLGVCVGMVIRARLAHSASAEA